MACLLGFTRPEVILKAEQMYRAFRGFGVFWYQSRYVDMGFIASGDAHEVASAIRTICVILYKLLILSMINEIVI